MGYRVAAEMLINQSTIASQNTFSRRRKIVCVPYEFFRWELGYKKFPDLTEANITYLESELLLRQLIPSDGFISAVSVDLPRDCWKLYMKSPQYAQLEQNEMPPEEWISLDPT